MKNIARFHTVGVATFWPKGQAGFRVACDALEIFGIDDGHYLLRLWTLYKDNAVFPVLRLERHVLGGAFKWVDECPRATLTFESMQTEEAPEQAFLDAIGSDGQDGEGEAFIEALGPDLNPASLPEMVIELIPHDGEFVRPDEYFTATLGPAEQEMVRGLRDAQNQVTIAERSAIPMGLESSHGALVRLLRVAVSSFEKRLAAIRSSR